MHVLARLLDPQTVEMLNHLALGGRRVVEGASAGQHKSPIRGASIEFRQHRHYVPGDEPRHIDWRVLARTDRAFVREFEEETNLRATVVLDASGSMAYGGVQSKFHAASRLAAALSYLMLASHESAGLTIANASSPNWLAPRSTTIQLARIVEAIESCEPSGPTVLEPTLHRLSPRLGRRSLIVLISDFFSSPELLHKGLARLAHSRHELVLVRVLHPDEASFSFDSWVRFVGLEGEGSRQLEAPQRRKDYLQRFSQHQQQLRMLASRVRADWIDCRSDEPVIDSVMAVVKRRGA